MKTRFLSLIAVTFLLSVSHTLAAQSRTTPADDEALMRSWI